MQLGLDITLTSAEELRFARYVQDEVIKQMDERLRHSVDRMHQVCWEYIRKQLSASPEIHAFISGKLRFAFGITEEEALAVAQKLIDTTIEDLKIDLPHQTVRGSLTLLLMLVPRDYSKILSIKEGHFTSVNKDGVEHLIPWLEWLLLRGHTQVVKAYHVEYVTRPNPRSRSGGAFMVEGGNYSIIPSMYTGTPLDNFITRALDGIGAILNKEVDLIVS
jgi:hypothetical protein